MLSGLFADALALVAIVFAAFRVGLSRFDLTGARTLAPVAWLVGHAALAATMVGGRGLGSFNGPLRSPALLAWFVCALAFATLLVALPALHPGLGTAAIPARDAALPALGAMLVPFWLPVAGSGRASPRTSQEGLAS